MEGPLASANHEIRDAEQHAVEARLSRLTEPKRLTDQVLFRLEELNLDGIDTIPEDYEPMLAELREHLSRQSGVDPRLLDRLRPGMKTADLIEAIFIIQEEIAPPAFRDEAFPIEERK